MVGLFQSLSRRNQLWRAILGAGLALGLAAFCGCATPTENDLPSNEVGGAPGAGGSSQTVAGAAFAGAKTGGGAGAPSAGATGLAGASNGGASNGGASNGGASNSAGTQSGGAAHGGTGPMNGGAPGTAGAGVAGHAAAGAPSAGASSGGATGGGSCAAAFSSGACLGMSVGTKVSAGGHNWTCNNDNCRNCENHPECAPGVTGCPWGAVWTDNGTCS